MGLLDIIFGFRARKDIEKAYHALAEILFVYIQRQYAREVDDRTGLSLATALTIELVGAPPDNQTLAQSVHADSHLLQQVLDQIKNDAEVCWIVSLFRHLRNTVPGAVTPATAESDAKLQKQGILLPLENIQLPASHKEFMRKVGEFELWAKRV